MKLNLTPNPPISNCFLSIETAETKYRALSNSARIAIIRGRGGSGEIEERTRENCVTLTEISRIVVGGAHQALCVQIRHEALHRTPIDAVTVSEEIQL